MLSLLPTLLVSAALADAPAMVYDLTLDGASVGTREVNVRYLPTAQGEVRILESYTEISATVAGVGYTLKNRASAKVGAGTPGFTSSVQENGAVREIQGRLLPDRRWQVTIAETGKLETYYLRPSELQLTSLDLLDAQRSRAMSAGTGTVAMLIVESGAVLSGPVSALGETSMQVGGVEVQASCARWTPETGPSELCWTSDGVLVRYTSTVLGRTVNATLRALPPPPDFGAIEGLPASGGALQEESL